MNKLSNTIFRRRYLVENLPDSIAASDKHIQIFENFVPDSPLRVRKERTPETDDRYFCIEKTEILDPDRTARKESRIELSKAEYELFDNLRGRETRKNRYFMGLEPKFGFYDVFLGPLRGLVFLKFEFTNQEDCSNVSVPFRVLMETSSDSFFDESNLVDVDFAAIRKHLSQK